METGRKRIETEDSGEKYLLFRLGGNEYGIDIDRVREIIGLIHISRIPGAPDYVSGVINLRGNAIPVLDLRHRLGHAVKNKFRTNCIMVVDVKVEGKQIPFGILIESVSEVLEIKRNESETSLALEPVREGELVEGFTQVEERTVTVLDLDAVVDEYDLAFVLRKEARG